MDRERTVALVGHPNVGKSAVFVRLTGSYVTCSNYPGTTIQLYEGATDVDGSTWRVLDTPGLLELDSWREHERMARDLLLFGQPEAVVQVADAKNPRRALALFVQLAELGLPMVLDLNMIDERRARGVDYSIAALEAQLGIPIVETVATTGEGIGTLRAALPRARIPRLRVPYGPLEPSVAALAALLQAQRDGSSRGVAALLLALPDDERDLTLERLDLDPRTRTRVRDAVEAARRIDPGCGYGISVARHRTASAIAFVAAQAVPRPAGADALAAADPGRVCAGCSTASAETAPRTSGPTSARTPVTSTSRARRSPPIAQRLGRWTVHPVWGIVILLAVLYGMYQLVGNFGAVVLVGWLEDTLFGAYLNPWVTDLADRFITWGLLRDLLVGEYGLLTMAITYAVALILPIVTTFFLAFGFLEDSGYFPRLTVLAHRMFRRMGLSGEAVLPMVLGLSCDTMATVTTRVLATPKERTIATLLLALGVPCSAQLAVLLAISASVSGWVLAGVLAITGLQLLIVGRLAAELIPGETAPFVTELPPLRWPQWRNIAAKTRARLVWYLTEVVPLFVIGTLALFALDKVGVLSAVQAAARPVVTGLLGLPGEASSAFVMGFFRRDYGAAGLYQLQQAGGLDTLQVLVSLVVITLFVPCIANLLVIIKERGWRTAVAIVGFIVPYSILVGTVVNIGARLLIGS